MKSLMRYVAVEKVNMSDKIKEAIPHLRNAVESLQQCWDSLGEIETIFQVEIETDALSDSGITICDAEELTDELLTEVLAKILKGREQVNLNL